MRLTSAPGMVIGLATALAAALALGGEPDLAVLPVANHTGQAAAPAQLEPLLEQTLAGLGWSALTSAQLRPVLREFRIRSRGWIGRREAETLAAQTGVRYLLLGSWDIFHEGDNPEVGFSLRLLDAATLTLVRAVSLGATGQDQVGLLGLGHVDSCRGLAADLLEQALADWGPREVAATGRAAGPCLVLVPLDNFSDTDDAGAILGGILLSGLIGQGYHVVEPGFVRELAISRESYPVGGVDLATAAALRRSLGADWVLTGAVDRWDAARGNPRTVVPQLACGLRVIDPRRGVVRLSREIETAGDRHDGLLQTGRIFGLVPLANEAVHEFIEDLESLTVEEINRDE